MIIKLCCVGKLKEKYYTDACEELIKRLSRFCTMRVCEVADEKAPVSLSPAEEMLVKQREGERLLAQISDKEYLIALDLGGKQCSSEAFAAKLQGLEDNGRAQIAFAIGGSLGLSPTVLARANERLQLSEMTFPHRIARLVLLEQIYRGYKILRGETYHK
ncbi:MAG: 23S rRNA (pseudouridine(1915)-N(3))-methyltransferase RlmH [Clostridiales bacterium]|nr:23S rRNA (pseudouridine(1915)-N(3))-methyltransferase RlmH [Clostridiales bacterium]